MATEKRVVFRSRWLPWLLLAPQGVVIGVFFFWPAAQALMQSLQQTDSFGGSVQWVGLDNFRNLFSDSGYLDSFETTAIFSALVAGLGIALSLLLAVFADRVVRGAGIYKTLLIWPYAVAPAVAGVLWLFMFSPSIGIAAYWLHALGIDWNSLLNGRQAMLLIVMAAVWKQISYNFLFFLAGLASIPKSLIEAAAIDGARPWKRFWSIQFPGVIVVDREMQILYSNSAAATLLSDSCSGLSSARARAGLVTGASKLFARHPGSDAQLRRLVGAASRGGAGGGMQIHARPDAMPGDSAMLSALVCPALRHLSSSTQPNMGTSVIHGAATVLTRHLLRPSPPPAGLLRDLFGLTRAEAEVAVGLAGGITAEDVACTRLVSLETVRSQIRNILRKTGATGLRDFERIIALSSTMHTKGLLYARCSDKDYYSERS